MNFISQKSRNSNYLLIAFLFFSSFSLSWADNEWTIDNLMTGLAKVQHIELEFKETRTSEFLTEDLVISGEMKYHAPDFMEKNVIEPFVENMTMDGDILTIEKVNKRGKSKVREYSLTSYEILNLAVEGIRATLSGDLSLLTTNNVIEFSGTKEEWVMTLVPKGETTKKYVVQVDFYGSDEKIQRIFTQEAGGDTSEIELTYLLYQ